jgi:transcriptional regulator with XRE-family HTH domain
VIRAARIRRGWRQSDLAAAAGVSRSTVSRIERGAIHEIAFGVLSRVAGALDVRLELITRSRGADLDRLLNQKHAALAEAVIARLRRIGGWVVRPEVSFSEWGERGIVDLLAWHEQSASVLVIELKTEIVDVGELLGTLDRKRRLAREIAKPFGWRPTVIGVCLLVAEGRTGRRRVLAHGATFRAALPDDGRRLRAWLREPVGELGAIAFVSDVRRGSVRAGFATVRRVSAARAGRLRAESRPPKHESSAIPAATEGRRSS